MMRRLCLVMALSLLPACGDDAMTAGSEDATSAEADDDDDSEAAPDIAPDLGDTTASAGDSTTSAPPDSAGPEAVTDIDDSPLGGERPAKVVLPADYSPADPHPLLMLLHGYSATGEVQDLYLDLSPRAAAKGIITIIPNGTRDGTGMQFWNASPGWCCDFGMSGIDDAGYLLGLIAEAQARYNIDPARIYLIGHSNGGFMSYKLACEHADVFAAISVIAGAVPLDRADCAPSESVSVLHVHGTSDTVILFSGTPGQYPSAGTSVARWAAHDGCELLGSSQEAALDYDRGVLGDETHPMPHPGCEPGRDVVLWQMQGSTHVPLFAEPFIPAVLDWFLAHPK
jgi:polyhydroxybutyrate depolymerase